MHTQRSVQRWLPAAAFVLHATWSCGAQAPIDAQWAAQSAAKEAASGSLAGAPQIAPARSGPIVCVGGGGTGQWGCQGGGYAGGDGGLASGGGVAGGIGAGGGMLLEAKTLVVQASGASVSARGGDGSLTWGGTIKLFYGVMNGAAPTAAGRIYDAGPGSFVP